MHSLTRIDAFGAQHVGAMIVDASGDIVEVRGDEEFRFPLASVTKLLTAMSIFVAIGERVVALDDRVGPPGSTVRHLLSHASGLGMSEPTVALAKPGAKRIYSNAGYELLGSHLVVQSKISFDEYLQAGVLQPLGMTATACPGSPAYAGIGTLRDLGRLAAECMAPRLVDPELMVEGTAVVFPGLEGVVPGFGRQEPCDWGLGFELKAHKAPHWTGRLNSPRSYGHFGQSGTFILVDPDAGYGLVMLSDRRFEQWAVEQWPLFCDDVYGEVVLGA